MELMKSLCVFAFGAVAVWAQAAPPAPPAAAPASSAMPNLPDDTVIATFKDGSTVTMGEFKSYYGILSPPQQQAILRDRGEFLHQWAVMRRLAQMANDRRLYDQSPYKEALEQARTQVL